MSIFNTRPRFQDRDIRQLSGDTITLSGETNISGIFRYIPGATTGYVLKAIDSNGTVGWQPVSVSADTNTFVTGGTLTGTDLVLEWNTGGSASAIDLSALSDTTYWTAGTSGTGSIRVTNGGGTNATGSYSVAQGLNTTASGDFSHSEGYLTIASGDYSHAGGDNSVASGTTSFIHSTDSEIRGDRSVLLGGQNLTGTTTDTVYVPNLTVRDNHMLHSDTTLEVSDIPGNLENIIKGSYTEFNWDGLTTNILSNNNPSGYTSFLLGNLTNFPSTNDYGFVSYYGSGYTRTGSPGTGTDFYRNRLILKSSSNSEGIIFSNEASKKFWWEIDNKSRMILDDQGRLGLGLNVDGTQDPSEELHVFGDYLIENTNGSLSTNLSSTSPLLLLSGGTNGITRYGVIVPTFDALTMGIRGGSDVTFTDYGKNGDAFVRSSNPNNGLNIISEGGTGTDDYIRFYAGQNASPGNTPDLYIQGSGTTRGNVGIGTDSPSEMLHVEGNTLIVGDLTVQTINTGTTVYLLGANSSGTVIQANDIYSDICAFCSSNVSGDTIVGSGTTETESVNSEGNTVDSTSPYSCTQWCAYNSEGTLVATTTDYETAEKYKLSGLIVRCCDGNSGDGGTDYGTSISGETTTPGGGPPTVITGLTRPFTVRNTRKVSFLNAHKSDILNSNQVSISDSTLGRIELSTLSSIEASFNSEIYGSNLSTILSSENGFITTSSNVSIIGSQYSVLSGVTGSTIIGGNNITGTDNDTVYVPKLNIDTLGGGTSINNLGIDVNGNVVVGTAGGGGIPEATTATTTNINFTGQTIYFDAVTPGTGNITNTLTGAKLGLIQKIYHNDATEPTYPVGWVLMGDAIYFVSTLNVIYAEWAGGTRVEYWYVQEQ